MMNTMSLLVTRFTGRLLAKGLIFFMEYLLILFVEKVRYNAVIKHVYLTFGFVMGNLIAYSEKMRQDVAVTMATMF